MSYSNLYSEIQNKNPKISTRWLRDKVIELTPLTRVREQWTGLMDEAFMQGFYIEGPLGPPVPLEENQALIVLARSLDKVTRRIVYTKELMHAFDTPEEKTDTGEKFDLQAEKFCDPTSDMSPQFRAESKAFWRALSVLCPEKFRLEFNQAINQDMMSIEVVAARLEIPSTYIRHLMRDDYLDIIEKLKK